MIDFKRYLGLSYDINNEFGVNCWGLYKLVQKNELGNDVISFKAINSSVRAISDKFRAEIKLSRHGHEQVKSPVDFDLVVMTKRSGRVIAYHCGVYIAGEVMHAKGDGQTGQVWRESLRSLQKEWRTEFWRYV